jgi:hypothetical protein
VALWGSRAVCGLKTRSVRPLDRSRSGPIDARDPALIPIVRDHDHTDTIRRCGRTRLELQASHAEAPGREPFP